METIIDFKETLKIINKNNTPIFFVTPNPNRGIGLEKEIGNYHIICSQKSDLVDYLREKGVSVFCLNDDKIKSSGKILANKKVIKYIKEKSKNKTANVLTFKPSPMIQKICDNNNFKYLGNNWQLNRKLENKVEFVKITKKLRIPNANGKIIKLKSAEEINLSFKNKKYVIQLPRGFSGNSTFLINGKKELENMINKYKDREVKISDFMWGETYTLNACVSKFGLFVSQPIFQITGLTSFNKNEFGTSGNDYTYVKKLRAEEKKKIFDYTNKIGKYISKTGYKGIFGLDFIVGKNGDVDLIEINPRLVGSMPVFTKLQIQNKQTPFLLLHILEFLNEEIKFSISQAHLFQQTSVQNSKLPTFSSLFAKWRKEKTFNGSQLILRNTSATPLKIVKSFPSGIYEMRGDKLVLKEKTYWIKRHLEQNELLIQCAKAKSAVEPDIEYANVQTSYGIMENRSLFNSYFGKIIRLVLNNIKIARC